MRPETIPKRLKRFDNYWPGSGEVTWTFDVPIILQPVSGIIGNNFGQIVDMIGLSGRLGGIASPSSQPGVEYPSLNNFQQDRCNVRGASHGYHLTGRSRIVSPIGG